MKFKDFSQKLESIEGISSRNDMTSELVQMYSELSLDEVSVVSYLLEGRVAPYFMSSEYNMSEKGILKVLSTYTSDDVVALRSNMGDIGLVAQKIVNNSGSFSVLDIYEKLWDIVNTTGSGSAERKLNIISTLFSQMSSIEAKYLCRIVSGNLRLGASVKTLLDVFSIHLYCDKSGRKILDSAYGVTCDIGYIATLVYGKDAVKKLENISPTVGVPILSRLVERVGSFEETFERLGESFLVQPKFDGLRCQIHFDSNGFSHSYDGRVWSGKLVKEGSLGMFGGSESKVRLFTRNLEDVTESFPEIVQAASKLSCESAVIDSEVIGWDYEKSVFKTYQETMTRRRKYDVSSRREDMPVRAFAFDIMYLNGESLLTVDTRDRVESLKQLIDENGVVALSENVVVKDINALNVVFDRWVESGLEGLIAKQFGGGYLPGVRNFEWIKLKKSMRKGLVDSVDLVILGYYKGSGSRSKFGIGAILGGVYNSSTHQFESVCKIGTGLTDALLETISKRLDGISVKDLPKNVIVSDNLIPDVWVNPSIVVSVEADEITKADVKGKVKPAGGLSLRFPRLIEFDRDKRPEDCTSVNELATMYKLSSK